MGGAGGLGPELLETCGRVCSALIMQGKKHNRQTGCMNPQMLPHRGETSGCEVLSAHLWSQLCTSSIKTQILIYFFFPLRLQVESWKVFLLFIPGNGAQAFTQRTVWRHCKIFWITREFFFLTLLHLETNWDFVLFLCRKKRSFSRVRCQKHFVLKSSISK